MLTPTLRCVFPLLWPCFSPVQPLNLRNTKLPSLRFVSILLEEFGDEWGNKWMFHLRWARPVDQVKQKWGGV